MKMIYTLIGLLVIGGFAFYLTSCNNKSNTKEKEEQPPQKPIHKEMIDTSKNNIYQGLRSRAFNITAEELGVKYSSDENKIYGLIMDWGLDEGTATIVSFITGDASIYLSSGGGVIGGSGHENIRSEAITLINKTEKYLNKTVKSETNPLPDKDIVNFYFLTTKGRYFGQEQMKNFDNNSSGWMDLFIEVNKLMTELRTTSPNKED